MIICKSIQAVKMTVRWIFQDLLDSLLILVSTNMCILQLTWYTLQFELHISYSDIYWPGYFCFEVVCLLMKVHTKSYIYHTHKLQLCNLTLLEHASKIQSNAVEELIQITMLNVCTRKMKSNGNPLQATSTVPTKVI